MRGDLAEEAEGIRLVAAFLVLTGERQRMLGEGVCLLQAAGAAAAPPPGRRRQSAWKTTASHAVVCSRACVSSDTASVMRPPRVYAAPKGAAIGEIDREVHILTDAHGAFEQGECPGQVALAEA